MHCVHANMFHQMCACTCVIWCEWRCLLLNESWILQLNSLRRINSFWMKYLCLMSRWATTKNLDFQTVFESRCLSQITDIHCVMLAHEWEHSSSSKFTCPLLMICPRKSMKIVQIQHPFLYNSNHPKEMNEWIWNLKCSHLCVIVACFFPSLVIFPSLGQHFICL